MFGYKNKYNKAQAKLDLISHKDFIRVSAFNRWFCDDTKPRDIYAHRGIYLRGDKLSTQHILDYWQSLTNLDKDILHELFDEMYFIVLSFETSIRNNWLKQMDI